MYYKKSYLLFLTGIVFFLALVCVSETEMLNETYEPSDKCGLFLWPEDQDIERTTKINEEVASSKLKIEMSFCIRDKKTYHLSDKDYEVLLKIVEAEAGGEDETGKLLVANVVLNRVNDNAFPDTVEEVVFQKEGDCYQFSPVGNGRYDTVCISKETCKAVERAINGEDLSEGALYFVAEKYADPERLEWFHNKLTLLYSHGGHNFYG